MRQNEADQTAQYINRHAAGIGVSARLPETRMPVLENLTRKRLR